MERTLRGHEGYAAITAAQIDVGGAGLPMGAPVLCPGITAVNVNPWTVRLPGSGLRRLFRRSLGGLERIAITARNGPHTTSNVVVYVIREIGE